MIRKFAIHVAAAVAALTFGAFASAGVSHADGYSPSQPGRYECGITGGNAEGCDHIPGYWNDFAGRVTPTRWDPCVNGHGLLYFQGCTRRSVSFPTWCRLNFDHGYYRNACAAYRS